MNSLVPAVCLDVVLGNVDEVVLVLFLVHCVLGLVVQVCPEAHPEGGVEFLDGLVHDGHDDGYQLGGVARVDAVVVAFGQFDERGTLRALMSPCFALMMYCFSTSALGISLHARSYARRTLFLYSSVVKSMISPVFVGLRLYRLYVLLVV